jgi:hypothetical protein
VRGDIARALESNPGLRWRRDALLPRRCPLKTTGSPVLRSGLLPRLGGLVLRLGLAPNLWGPWRRDGLLPRSPITLKTTGGDPLQGSPLAFGRSPSCGPVGPVHGLDRGGCGARALEFNPGLRWQRDALLLRRCPLKTTGSPVLRSGLLPRLGGLVLRLGLAPNLWGPWRRDGLLPRSPIPFKTTGGDPLQGSPLAFGRSPSCGPVGPYMASTVAVVAPAPSNLTPDFVGDAMPSSRGGAPSRPQVVRSFGADCCGALAAPSSDSPQTFGALGDAMASSRGAPPSRRRAATLSRWPARLRSVDFVRASWPRPCAVAAPRPPAHGFRIAPQLLGDLSRVSEKDGRGHEHGNVLDPGLARRREDPCPPRRPRSPQRPPPRPASPPASCPHAAREQLLQTRSTPLPA